MAIRSQGLGYRGPKGMGIASASINSAGHLILKYDDANGTTQDVGLVDGADGASVLVGNGPPAASAGRTGDVYVDAQTGDLYRKDA